MHTSPTSSKDLSIKEHVRNKSKGTERRNPECNFSAAYKAVYTKEHFTH